MKTLLAAVFLLLAVNSHAIPMLELTVVQNSDDYAITFNISGVDSLECDVFANGLLWFRIGEAGSNPTMYGNLLTSPYIQVGENNIYAVFGTGEIAHAEPFMIAQPTASTEVPDTGAALTLLCAGLTALFALKHIIAA
jgi:hypothetical protein